MNENETASSRPAPLKEPDLEKLADLCAVGAYPIPNDLTDEQQARLLAAISRRRRKRLVNLFAAAIADEIWRDRQT